MLSVLIDRASPVFCADEDVHNFADNITPVIQESPPTRGRGLKLRLFCFLRFTVSRPQQPPGWHPPLSSIK